MIHLREAFSLAQTKFKRRKLRNFFVAFTISIGSVFVLAALFAVNGLLHTGKQIFKDSLNGRYFTVETFTINGAPESLQPDGTLQNTGTPFILDTEKYKRDNQAYHVTGVTLQKMFLGQQAERFLLGGVPTMTDATVVRDTSGSVTISGQNSGLFLSSSDPLFIQDFIYSGYSFDEPTDEYIPVIIPKSTVLSGENIGADADMKTRVEATQRATETYIGKTATLLQQQIDPTTGASTGTTATDLHVRVVGYSTDDTFGSGAYIQNAIIFPSWALEKNPTLHTLFDSADVETRAIAEFSTKDDRDAFVKAAMQKQMQQWNGVDPAVGPPPVQSYTMPLKGKYEAFADIIKLFKNIAFGVGGFFLAISAFFVLTTVGKIAADSKKEIGVFRAVGAQKRDIKKIFFAYTFILSTCGFLFGTLIAVLFDIGLSIKMGEDTFYMMLNSGTTLDVPEPTFLFLAFPWHWYLVCYVGAVLIGFIAAYLPVRRASRIDPITALREE